MRFNMRMTGHTPNGTECIADTSVYLDEGSPSEKVMQENSKYAVWFENKPGFPMVADGVAVTVDHYHELAKPKQPARTGMGSMGPVSREAVFLPLGAGGEMPPALQDILSGLFGGDKPKK